MERNKDLRYSEFWSGFHEYIRKEKSHLKHFGSLKSQDLYDLRDGISYSGCDLGFITGDKYTRYKRLWLAGILNSEEDWLSAKVILRGESHRFLFDALKKEAMFIERHFQTQFKFELYDPPKYSIGILRENINFERKRGWKNLFEWLRHNLEELEYVVINKFALYFYEIKGGDNFGTKK